MDVFIVTETDTMIDILCEVDLISLIFTINRTIY